jgi:hypothetical protein
MISKFQYSWDDKSRRDSMILEEYLKTRTNRDGWWAFEELGITSGQRCNLAV